MYAPTPSQSQATNSLETSHTIIWTRGGNSHRLYNHSCDCSQSNGQQSKPLKKCSQQSEIPLKYGQHLDSSAEQHNLGVGTCVWSKINGRKSGLSMVKVLKRASQIFDPNRS